MCVTPQQENAAAVVRKGMSHGRRPVFYSAEHQKHLGAELGSRQRQQS